MIHYWLYSVHECRVGNDTQEQSWRCLIISMKVNDDLQHKVIPQLLIKSLSFKFIYIEVHSSTKPFLKLWYLSEFQMVCVWCSFTSKSTLISGTQIRSSTFNIYPNLSGLLFKFINIEVLSNVCNTKPFLIFWSLLDFQVVCLFQVHLHRSHSN